MKFPGVDFCGELQQKLLVVGTISSVSSEKPEIIFYGFGKEEAFHVYIDIENNFIGRWGVIDEEETKMDGDPEDGTTIGFDEPFVLVYVLTPYCYHNLLFTSEFSVILMAGFSKLMMRFSILISTTKSPFKIYQV